MQCSWKPDSPKTCSFVVVIHGKSDTGSGSLDFPPLPYQHALPTTCSNYLENEEGGVQSPQTFDSFAFSTGIARKNILDVPLVWHPSICSPGKGSRPKMHFMSAAKQHQKIKVPSCNRTGQVSQKREAACYPSAGVSGHPVSWQHSFI